LTTQITPEFLDEQQAADFLNVSLSTLRRSRYDKALQILPRIADAAPEPDQQRPELLLKIDTFRFAA
jgi:hypothetical protein